MFLEISCMFTNLFSFDFNQENRQPVTFLALIGMLDGQSY